MTPMYTLLCPIAAIGITGLYAAWNRYRVSPEAEGPDKRIRERVTYMLWVAAKRV